MGNISACARMTMAMTIILISFPGEIRSEILMVPIFYGLALVPLAALTALLLRHLDPSAQTTSE